MLIEKNLAEITARKTEIRSILESGTEVDLAALETELRTLDTEKETLEKRQAMAQEIITRGDFTPRLMPGAEKVVENARDTAEYRSVWLKNLQGVELTESEKRYAATNAAAAVPTVTSEILFDKMAKLAPMLAEITLLRVAGNVNFAAEGVRNDAYDHTENAAITAATDTLVKVSLSGYEYNKLLYISKTVQSMTINAFEGWLIDMIAADIAIAIENKIINGTGSSQPKGIEYAGTWTSGTNLVVCTGTYVVTYADIVNLIGMLPARYDANAKFLVSKAMAYQGLANIQDTTKRPIFVPDATGEYPMRVLGYPVIISDKVAAKTLYLGDYKNVVGNLSQDVIVERDMSAGFASNSIAFRGGAVFDCNVTLADAFVKLTVNTY